MSSTSRLLLRNLIALAATATAILPARAQQPPAAEPVDLPPALAMFTAGKDPNEVVQRLTLPDIDLAGALRTLEDLTGRVVLRPQSLPPAVIAFDSREPMTRAEAVFALETLLSLNGIGLVPVDDKFLKVVPLGQVRSEAPQLVTGSLRDEPASGKFVSKLFRLQYLDSASFQTQVQPFLSQNHSIVPFQNSNAVIVTDTVANLQRLEYVVSEVDRRLNIETKFYQIQYAAATELAQQIKAMLDSARQGMGGGTGQAQRGVTLAAGQIQVIGQPGGAGAAAAGGVPLQVVFSSNTSISADERTNQLIVIADPANLTFFDNLIGKLDVPADPPTRIEVIPMKHADAVELTGLLSEFVGGRSSSSRRTGDRNTASQRTRGTPFPNLAQPQPDAAQRQQTVQNTMQAAMAERTAQFSDFMSIVADERSNAVIVSGTEFDLSLIVDVIEKLDVLLAQVRIEAIIAEVSLTDGVQRGLDAFGNVSYQESDGAIIFDGAVGTIGATIGGFLKGGTLSDITIDAVIAAARTNSQINILSTPTITTTHNKEASIVVGEARPIVTSTQTSISTQTGSYSSYQFQDIAIELKVKPIIGPNNVVQLEIEQKIDDIGGSVTINNEEQPIISRRQANSYLSVKSGQLVVLGGLQKNTVNRTKNRMPILGEIPLLGSVFTRHRDDKTKTELLVFIKPTVIRTTEDADADARASLRGMHPGEENAARLEELTGERLAPQPEEKKKSTATPPRRGRP